MRPVVHCQFPSFALVYCIPVLQGAEEIIITDFFKCCHNSCLAQIASYFITRSGTIFVFMKMRLPMRDLRQRDKNYDGSDLRDRYTVRCKCNELSGIKNCRVSVNAPLLDLRRLWGAVCKATQYKILHHFFG